MKSMGFDIQAAVASKTDEPSWAKICMDNLMIMMDDDNDAGEVRRIPMISCFENGRMVEISYGNKKDHFQRLHKKTGIPFDCMAFFDNEYGNIRSVSNLGVKCFYTPDGMMKEHWEKAKADFDIEFDSCEADFN